MPSREKHIDTQQFIHESIQNELHKFRHRIATRVRTYDVDRLGIVHNAVYFYWLEAARIEYFRAIGLPIDKETFVSKHRFVVAHQEIDYLSVAEFDDEYEILTRVSYIKNSSLGFEQVIRLANGRDVVKASVILVQLNPASNLPEHIQEAYRSILREYEGEHLQFIR